MIRQRCLHASHDEDAAKLGMRSGLGVIQDGVATDDYEKLLLRWRLERSRVCAKHLKELDPGCLAHVEPAERCESINWMAMTPPERAQLIHGALVKLSINSSQMLRMMAAQGAPSSLVVFLASLMADFTTVIADSAHGGVDAFNDMFHRAAEQLSRDERNLTLMHRAHRDTKDQVPS